MSDYSPQFDVDVIRYPSPKYCELPKSSELSEWGKDGCMMTSSNGNISRVTGPLWKAGHLRISITKASDAELWCFLGSAPEQTVKQTSETPIIWDAIALIISSGNHMAASIQTATRRALPGTTAFLQKLYCRLFLRELHRDNGFR